MQDRLVRTRNDRVFAGVCGGLARYFNIDSTIVRLVFVVAVLFGGVSPLIYVILWIIMPEENPAYLGTNTPPQLTQQQQTPVSTPAQQDPTGEWKFDPYTGEPIKHES